MGKKSNKSKGNGMEDWIVSLAAASNSSETKILSKEERKQKRAAKKARRQHKQEKMKKPFPSKRGASKIPAKAALSDVPPSKLRLKRLSLHLRSILESHGDDQDRRHPYNAASGKKKRSKGWNEASIQPRSSDYSGIGLARESLYISFLDPSYFPKLEEEFREHIPGFFGKQRSKAMKRQLDGNMLWRQLAEKKLPMGKKLKGMTPDERVQAMIDSGMI